MAGRSSPLSLKARAIALLAQREHSVAELRRKLLRLAQLRDLQAWQDARVPAVDAAAPVDSPGSRPATVSVSAARGATQDVQAVAVRAGIGSFDLDEDWAEGELEAFMDEWGLEAQGHAREGSEQPPEMAGVDTDTDTDTDADADADLDQPAPGRSRPQGRTSPASRPRRRPERARPAPPGAEALSAVMEASVQQARAEEVELLLQWLQQRGYLSEARLVESRINARASRYGNLRIQQELRQLGVAPDEEQQSRLKDSELERAREVWRRKFGGELPADAAARAKQMRFLAARGFSSEVVRRVLRGEDD